MLTKRIIPCLDVNDGKVVKGINFVELKDAGDPVNCAIEYNNQGADELVFLDITASSGNRDIIIEIVNETTRKCFMPVTVGGGVKSNNDIKKILLAGADKVAINTSAVKNPDLISTGSNTFGAQCIVIAIDAKKKENTTSEEWEVYINGGRTPTGIDVISWAKEAESKGAGEILLTSMDKDGTKSGYDINLTKRVSESVSIPIIASGGAGELKHFSDVLSKGKADAILAASMFHFGEYSIKEAKNYLKNNNIPVRL